MVAEDLVYSVTSNLPPEDYALEGGFVGRTNDRIKLKELLYGDQYQVLTLTGSGGVGKTALALNVAYEILDDSQVRFSAIVWFSAKETILTPEGIVDIVPQIRSFEELLEKIIAVIQPANLELLKSVDSTNKIADYLLGHFSQNPILLIIDNLESVMDDTELLEFLKEVPRPSKVLITSRRGLGEVEKRFPLEALSPTESTRLFRLVCRDKKLDDFAELDNTVISRLTSQVNNYPLAIKWAIGKTALGKDLEDSFKSPLEGTSEIAQFCFNDIFSMLSTEEKKCIYAISMFDEPPTSNMLFYLVDFEKDIFEDAIRNLILASLVFPQKEVVNEIVNTKYSILSLTRDYVQKELDKEQELRHRLAMRFSQLRKLAEEEEKTLSLRAHSIWSIGAKTTEDWLAVSKTKTARELELIGQIEKAAELYSDAERISPNLPYVVVAHAKFLHRQHKSNEAEKRIKRITERDPSNFYAWYVWGVIKKKDNKTDEAVEKLRKALEIVPDSIPALYDLGRVFTYQGKYEEADKQLKEALNLPLITPVQRMIVLCHLADNHRRWSFTFRKKKDYDSWENHLRKALQLVSTAIELDPLDSRTHHIYKSVCLEFGIGLAHLNRLEEAKDCLLKAAEETKVHGRKLTISRKIAASAFYELAKLERSSLSPSLDEITKYVKRGIAVSPDSKITRRLSRLRKWATDEKARMIGKVVYTNTRRNFGLIESGDETYIFFPSCLEWFCDDLSSLQNFDVSFVPDPDESDTTSNRIKAIRIRLESP